VSRPGRSQIDRAFVHAFVSRQFELLVVETGAVGAVMAPVPDWLVHCHLPPGVWLVCVEKSSQIWQGAILCELSSVRYRAFKDGGSHTISTFVSPH
jgi:hypothetical protein